MRTTRVLSAATALVAGILTVATVQTQAAGSGTIDVPDDFVPALSGTRSTGHYEVVAGGLRVWTESNTSTDKVAEYVATNTPLAAAGEPQLNQNFNTVDGTPPGFQLVTDFDGDGSSDGILVGEPKFYGNDWWLNTAAKQSVKDNAPITGGGKGSPWHGTLDEWRAKFPKANVQAFGFSLGSGVKGDWTISSIDFAGTNYTFAVILSSKNQCKDGGWATSTKPVFQNQGDCVSSFARG